LALCASQARVEHVSDRVSEEVEAIHGQRERQTGLDDVKSFDDVPF
jgi:hypothetical protein